MDIKRWKEIKKELKFVWVYPGDIMREIEQDLYITDEEHEKRTKKKRITKKQRKGD